MDQRLQELDLHIQCELGGRRVKLTPSGRKELPTGVPSAHDKSEEEPDWKIGDTLLALMLWKDDEKCSMIFIVNEEFTIDKYQHMVESLDLPEGITLRGAGFHKMTSKHFDGRGLIYSYWTDEEE